MKTVILAGGFGTRIRDVADNIPKPMIPVGRYPILWHIMKYYSRFNHKDFVLCLGYKSDVIKDFFLNYQMRTSDVTLSLNHSREIQYNTSHNEEDWTVTLAETGVNTMTGGRIFRIRDYIQDDENFFLTYGDGVGNIDLNALATFHKSHGKILTIT
ncbi:MAG: glucose-1-phosphate cytidylyltransferase, partial [Methylocystaceae bacterium]|nr:glucose-1-phosphate cytidylyltransferase [Methylocystaceae bacterium]